MAAVDQQATARLQSSPDTAAGAPAGFWVTAIECADTHRQRDVEKRFTWLQLKVLDRDSAEA